MLKRLVTPPWVRTIWALLPWAGCLGLAVGLLLTHAQLNLERAECARDKALAGEQAAKTEAANANRKSAAVETHERTTLQMQPIILSSKEAANAYAQTPAGRAPCLDPERVRAILDTRAALFAFTPASRAGPMHAGPALPYAAVER
jgi:hypothetical protein